MSIDPNAVIDTLLSEIRQKDKLIQDVKDLISRDETLCGLTLAGAVQRLLLDKRELEEDYRQLERDYKNLIKKG